MFKRLNVVLHCPFISWHLLVNTLVQLRDGHLNDVKSWQLVQEALCAEKQSCRLLCQQELVRPVLGNLHLVALLEQRDGPGDFQRPTSTIL